MQRTMAKKYPRPIVETSHVEPELAGWAHLVVDSSNSSLLGRESIFLGPQQSAKEREALDAACVTGIVNCTNNFPNYHHQQSETSSSSSIEYCRVAVNDEFGANILVYLDGATAFIQRHVCNGGSVLVHCQMGISRSATVVIAYLMRFHGMGRDDAYRTVKSRRPGVEPNPGFWEQLRVYEGRLRHDAPSAKEEITSKFDKDWAEISLANFQTIGHLLDNGDDRFPEILAETNASEVLYVATDYIFGRGIQTADLSWFGALCQRFAQFHCEREVQNIVTCLFEDGSEFADQWSGEVYPERVEQILAAIHSSEEEYSSTDLN